MHSLMHVAAHPKNKHYIQIAASFISLTPDIIKGWILWQLFPYFFHFFGIMAGFNKKYKAPGENVFYLGLRPFCQ